VYTSDLLNSMTTLRFSAYVYPENVPTSPLTSEPRKLSLEPGDDDRKHRVTFKNITMDTVQMQLVWFDHSYLDVQVPDAAIGPGETADVIVGIDLDRHKLRFETSFTIEISDEDRTRMTVPVTFGKGAVRSPDVEGK
jgi:hypothetical protein